MFVKSDLPQADNLYKVIETVETVSEGAETDIQISEAIGYTDRQYRYYRHVAEVLGFVSNNRNCIFRSKLVLPHFWWSRRSVYYTFPQ